MNCALCNAEAAVTGLGWRRKLDDSGLPAAIRQFIGRALRDGWIPVGARCKPLAKPELQRTLHDDVWMRYQARLSARRPGIRSDVAVFAAAVFWQQFLWTANQTDKGDEIDLYGDTSEALRAWYDLIAAGDLFDIADLQIALPDGNVYVWTDGNILLLEGIETRERGKGHGKRLMKLICGIADKHHVVIVGKAEPYTAFGLAPALDAPALMRYYSAFGFVPGRIPAEPHGIWRDPKG